MNQRDTIVSINVILADMKQKHIRANRMLLKHGTGERRMIKYLVVCRKEDGSIYKVESAPEQYSAEDLLKKANRWEEKFKTKVDIVEIKEKHGLIEYLFNRQKRVNEAQNRIEQALETLYEIESILNDIEYCFLNIGEKP